MSEETMHEAQWQEIERENRARNARLAAYREEELQRDLENIRLATRAFKKDKVLLVSAMRKAGVL